MPCVINGKLRVFAFKDQRWGNFRWAFTEFITKKGIGDTHWGNSLKTRNSPFSVENRLRKLTNILFSIISFVTMVANDNERANLLPYLSYRKHKYVVVMYLSLAIVIYTKGNVLYKRTGLVSWWYYTWEI